MDKRKHPRFCVLAQVTVELEFMGGDVTGSIIDISKYGLQLMLNWRRMTGTLIEGRDVNLRFQVGETVIERQAKVVRYPSKSRLSIFMVEPIPDQVIGRVISKQWGYVHWKDGVAVAYGHLTRTMTKDLANANRSGLVIDVTNVKSITDTGMETIETLRLSGAKIVGLR